MPVLFCYPVKAALLVAKGPSSGQDLAQYLIFQHLGSSCVAPLVCKSQPRRAGSSQSFPQGTLWKCLEGWPLSQRLEQQLRVLSLPGDMQDHLPVTSDEVVVWVLGLQVPSLNI